MADAKAIAQAIIDAILNVSDKQLQLVQEKLDKFGFKVNCEAVVTNKPDVDANLKVDSKTVDSLIKPIIESTLTGVADKIPKKTIDALLGALENINNTDLDTLKKINDEGIRKQVSVITERKNAHLEEIKAKEQMRKNIIDYAADVNGTNRTKIFGSTVKTWGRAFKEVFGIGGMGRKVPETKMELGEDGQEHEVDNPDYAHRYDNLKKVGSNLLKSVGGFVINLIKKIILGIFKVILTAFKTAFSFGIKLILAPVTKIYQMVKGIFKSAIEQSQIIKSLHTMVITPLLLLIEFLAIPLIPVVVSFMKNLLEFIISNKDKIMDLGNKVAEFLKQMLSFASEIDSASFFENPIASILDMMSNMAKSILEYLTTNSSRLTTKIYEILVSGMNYLVSGMNLAAEIIQILGDAIIKAAKTSEFQTLVTTFKSVIDIFFDTLEEIINTPEVREAIRSILSTILGNLWSFIGTAINALTNVSGNEYSKHIEEKSNTIHNTDSYANMTSNQKDYVDKTLELLNSYRNIPLFGSTGIMQLATDYVEGQLDRYVNNYNYYGDTNINGGQQAGTGTYNQVNPMNGG